GARAAGQAQGAPRAPRREVAAWAARGRGSRSRRTRGRAAGARRASRASPWPRGARGIRILAPACGFAGPKKEEKRAPARGPAGFAYCAAAAGSITFPPASVIFAFACSVAEPTVTLILLRTWPEPRSLSTPIAARSMV